MGGIKSTLPISASTNPFEVLASSKVGIIDNLAMTSPKSSKSLPIVQTTLIRASFVVSLGRGRPPNNQKTQLEIDAGIQQTLSLSPGVWKGKHSVSLGDAMKGSGTPKGKRSKRSIINPLVTRLGAMKCNLQSSFGEGKSSSSKGKRGASDSPREQ